MLPSLAELLRYEHPPVIRAYIRNHSSDEQCAKKLFADMLRFLWVSRKHQADREQYPAASWHRWRHGGERLDRPRSAEPVRASRSSWRTTPAGTARVLTAGVLGWGPVGSQRARRVGPDRHRGGGGPDPRHRRTQDRPKGP